MILPDSYIRVRRAILIDEVSYGSGGIKLFGPDDIDECQVGYSVAPDGKSLCSHGAGSWQSSWIAIGHETACGDPLFIESADPALPVLTALHGEGKWEPMPVAISLNAFAQLFSEFARIAKGRSTPVELDHNPLSEAERDAFLRRVDQSNESQFESRFWAVMLEG